MRWLSRGCHPFVVCGIPSVRSTSSLSLGLPIICNSGAGNPPPVVVVEAINARGQFLNGSRPLLLTINGDPDFGNCSTSWEPYPPGERSLRAGDPNMQAVTAFALRCFSRVVRNG
jgi:hypothetical protein